MWQRIIRSGERIAAPRSEAGTGARDPRRAYYRIQAWVPVRLAKLAPDAVEAAVYDLLLETSAVEVRRPLSGRDGRLIVFSGGGLALDVDFDFAWGDAYRVELLLPAPHARVVRAVAEAVEDSAESLAQSGKRRLGLAFCHIEPAERDAVVAYGYDLQRIALRAKNDGAGVRP